MILYIKTTIDNKVQKLNIKSFWFDHDDVGLDYTKYPLYKKCRENGTMFIDLLVPKSLEQWTKSLNEEQMKNFLFWSGQKRSIFSIPGDTIIFFKLEDR